MKAMPYLLVSAVILLLVLALFPIGPPIVDTGDSSVSPKKVRRFDTVTVSRNLRSYRADDVTVVRTMVRGDCNKNCEIIDLPGGRLNLQPGDYKNVSRDHIIPSTAQNGQWRLVFSLLWRDLIGRTKVEVLPELQIEVEGP